MEKTFIYNPEEFNFSCRLYSVESFVRLFNQNKLIFEECRWSTRQCSLFIESLLIRIPLDVFYIDRTSEKYKIISGSNRLSAIKLILLESYKLEGLEFLTELNGLTFQQLSRKYQRRILESDLRIHFINPGTPANIVDNISRRIHSH
jgi:hypothetical protein